MKCAPELRLLNTCRLQYWTQDKRSCEPTSIVHSYLHSVGYLGTVSKQLLSSIRLQPHFPITTPTQKHTLSAGFTCQLLLYQWSHDMATTSRDPPNVHLALGRIHSNPLSKITWHHVHVTDLPQHGSIALWTRRRQWLGRSHQEWLRC